jgi:hypothetical protein
MFGMSEADAAERGHVLERLRALAVSGEIRITQHAHQEMVEEDIRVDEVLEVIRTGAILEYYPGHRRGACCLLGGTTQAGRPLHLVCTTALPTIIVVTAYEPMPPKWVSLTERGHRL